MRIILRLFGLLLVSGLTACAAQPLINAELMASPTFTLTAPPPATVTATTAPTFTSTPTATPRPTDTPTPPPTATREPVPPEPTAVLTPIPVAPPAPDGVVRTADVPILMYHYISASPSAQDRIRYGLSVPPEMFDAQLKLLADNGYTTITLRDLYNHLAIGTPLPEKPIILTFDDGYLDNYTNAFPLLRNYGMSGTFFVLTGPADEGQPAYVSWDMIQEMSDAGMDIQLHSRAHLDMRNRTYDWLVFQIIGGRQSIEGHTGKPVNFIAYPSGKYDANLQRFLGDTNFWAAVTTASGRRHVLSEALAWDRVRISGQLRLADFAKLVGIRPGARPTATQLTITPTPQAATSNPTVTPTHSVTETRPATTPLPPGTMAASATPSQTSPASPLITPTSDQSLVLTPTP